MDEFRARINWTEALNYSKTCDLRRGKMKHEQFKYRLLSFIERTFYGGKDIFAYSNWQEVTNGDKD